MQRSCGECRKLRTNECRRPDYCVSHGYSDFSPHRIGRVCPVCNIGLRVRKTDPVKNSNVVYTTKYCPACGYRVKITFDAQELPFLKKKSAAKDRI